jgi:hypothetical protein
MPSTTHSNPTLPYRRRVTVPKPFFAGRPTERMARWPIPVSGRKQVRCTLHDDVLHLILAHLASPELAAFARASRAYQALALPYLYKSLTIGPKANVSALRKFLKANPHLAERVTTLRIRHHKRCSRSTESPQRRNGCPPWEPLPNLRYLELDFTHPHEMENANTCLAEPGTTAPHHNSAGILPPILTVKLCSALRRQRPETVLIRLNSGHVGEVLCCWESLFPFPPDTVRRLVVVTDVNKPAHHDCKLASFGHC